MNFQDISWTAPDLRIRTVIEVTDTLDSTRIAYGDTATYGERIFALTNYSDDLFDAQQHANWLANTYSETHQEITLVVRLGRDSNRIDWTDMLGLDIGDLVNVIVIPAAGGFQNDWDCFVETIDLTMTGNYWEWTLGLSNAEHQRTFILDDSVLGRFDFGGLLGW